MPDQTATPSSRSAKPSTRPRPMQRARPSCSTKAPTLICSISLGSPRATGCTPCRRRPPISRTAFIPYPLLSSASGPLISS
nr:MAG TPA: hypothetical protein [Caudoviricetes sp.]